MPSRAASPPIGPCRPSCAATILCAILLASGCADERVSGGNSSGTNNTLAGCLVDSSGRPVDGAHVVARSLRWSPDDASESGLLVRHSSTDAAGRFRFVDLAPDTWVVEASIDHFGRLFQPVVVGRSSEPTDLGSGIAEPTRPLVGRVRIDSDARIDSGICRIAGTGLVSRVDSTGVFRFPSVPGGIGRLVVELSSGSLAFRAETLAVLDGSRDSLRLTATSGEAEDYATWPGMRTAVVDLASPSSYLGSTQVNVPILVRLDETILPEWEPTPSALRFSNAGGKHLPFDVELWNASTRQALVWVLLDTMPKGSARQRLNLHWGKAGAPGRSNGAGVFSRSRGWVGAWHFSVDGPFRNATGGTPLETGSRPSFARTLEGGVELASTTRLVLKDPILARTTGVSIFAHVRIDSLAPARRFLFRLGAIDSASFDWAMSLVDSNGTLMASFATRKQPSTPAPPSTTAPIPRSEWIVLGGVFDTTTQRVRLELPDDSNRSAIAHDTMHLRNLDPSLVVGGGIAGVVDELRLVRLPMHPDFIRAQWLSWNPSSHLLRWNP